MRLVYRVDGGAELGLGHVARAIAVTKALGAWSDWEVSWASRGGSFVQEAAQESGAPVLLPRAGEGERAFLERSARGAAALLLDRKLPYGLDDVAALSTSCPVVCLDVECEGMFAAAATVFPIAHLDPRIADDVRWRSSGRLLHGGEWVIVHPRVQAVRRALNATEPEEHCVVVVTGGSDPADVATTALDWLDGAAGSFRVEVLVGVANPRRKALTARALLALHPTVLIQDPAEFAVRESHASVAIATFGISAYELAYLGVPAVLVSHSLENAAAAAKFAEHGSAVDLGPVRCIDVRVAAHVIDSLLRDSIRRKAMRSAGVRLLDGGGAERVARLVAEDVGKG